MAKPKDEPLKTVRLERVPILSEGGPYFGQGSPKEGDFYSKAQLDQIVADSRELSSEVKAPNKIGHSAEQKLLANSGIMDDEQPAAGWLELDGMTVDKDPDDGKWKIYTDIAKVPAKIAKLFGAGAFRTRSVELSRIRSQESDGEKVYDQVVTGLAWLGAKAPAVRTLADIVSWYSDEERDEARIITLLAADDADVPKTVTRVIEYATTADIVWQPEAGFQDVLCDLRSALNPPGELSRYWVQDVSVGLDAAIVQDYDSNKTWIVPFSMGDDGQPTPAPADEWVEAEQAWVKATDELSDRNFGATVENQNPAAYTENVTEAIKKLSSTSDEQIIALAKSFSIEAPADQLRDKVAEHLTTFGIAEPAATEPAKAEPVKVIEPGTQMSADEIAKLRTDAELGRRSFEERRIDKREETMMSAVGGKEPKLDPADLDEWRAFYDANPELCVKTLAAMPAKASTRTFGQDDNLLPTGVTPEDAAAEGDKAYREYAAATGVEVGGANG